MLSGFGRSVIHPPFSYTLHHITLPPPVSCFSFSAYVLRRLLGYPLVGLGTFALSIPLMEGPSVHSRLPVGSPL
jgi:hypothetical protein